MNFLGFALLVFLTLFFLPVIAGLFSFSVLNISSLGTLEKVFVLGFPFVIILAIVMMVRDRDTLISFFSGRQQPPNY